MAKSNPSMEAKKTAGRQAPGSKKTAPGRNGSSRGGERAQGRRGEVGGATQSEGERVTGTADEHYNLVSVLYHALQGAETNARYIQDADEASDTELAEFFESAREDYQQVAERAKELLGSRLQAGVSLGGKGGGEGEEAE